MNASKKPETRVLVIDDEKNLREMLEIGLADHGFLIHAVADGNTALQFLREAEVDAVVCDVMLPRIDGISLLPELRRLTEAPIIMLSAKGGVSDRVTGLERGADDYMAKPFALEELAARLTVAVRRPHLRTPAHLRFEDLLIDFSLRSVSRDERAVELSRREFDLLAVLARSPRQIFSRERLLELVWGDDNDVTTGSVDTYISYLRAKIDHGAVRKLIHTVRGVGYSLR